MGGVIFDTTDHEEARRLINFMLEKAFVENFGNGVEAAEDQAILAAAFKEIVDAWRERKRSSRSWGPLDSRQVVRAYFIGAWRFLVELNLDDKTELNALANDLERELLALQYVCDPDT